MKTIELKRTNGDVIFSHECEDNSTLKTIEELRTIDKEFDLHCADLRNVDLRHADLSGADLNGADLRYADLSGAKLRDAKLRNADSRNADLHCADLRHADLRNADLRCADLRHADLRNTCLSGADLRHADLRNTCLGGAYLWHADLSGADLSGADLRHADLRNTCLGGAYLWHADLSGADLSGADLWNADLSGAYLSNINVSEKTAFLLPQCPSEGSFVAWKKVGGNMIVKLLVTEDAKRSSGTTLKCRCSKAKVLAIENIDGSESKLKEVVSSYDSDFVYRLGETVEVKNFDDDRWNECSSGIHFFIAREMAVKY